jgi:outer membrane receptor protein involved in Fe transport
MKKMLLLLFLCVLSFHLFAQSSSKIVGNVTDKANGNPLPGVNITVENSSLGAVSDNDGFFVILNVPIGTHTLKASYIGYQDMVIENVRLSANITSEVNFELQQTTLELEKPIIITAQKPLVEKHITSSISSITSEAIESIPIRGMNNLLAVQPSVVVQDDNVYIRGGRDEEVGYYLDGALTNNPLNNTNGVYVIQEAIEELQVFAGGYTAQYGGANSGIVFTDLKTGMPDYHFSVDFQTDKFADFGKKFLGTYSYRDHILSATASGPIMNKNIRFFAAVENTNEGDTQMRFGKGFEFNNLIDMNPLNPDVEDNPDTVAVLKYKDGYTPKNSLNLWAVNSTLVFDYSPYIFRLTGIYGNNREYYDDEPLRHILNTRKQRRDTDHNLITGKFTHIVNSKTYYDVKLSYYRRHYEVKDDWFGNNWRKWYDSTAVADYTDGRVIYRDKYNEQYDYMFNGIEFERDGTVSYYWYVNNKQSYLGGSCDFVTQYNKNNEIKMGLDARQYTMRYFAIRPRVMSLLKEGRTEEQAIADGSWKDYISTCYGYNLSGKETDKWPDKPKTPFYFAAYITDKIEMNDLIIHGGVRYDYFYSDDRTVEDPQDPPIDLDNDLVSSWKKVKAFQQISPRLGISFPVSEKTVFYLQYGKFIQMPQLDEVYFGRYLFDRQIISKGNYYIDPIGFNLKPIRTTSYEVGFRKQLSDFAAFDLVGFYKNVKGQIQVDRIIPSANADINTPYEVFVNQDFATTKGMEFRLTLRRSNRLQTQFYYTLTAAEGTGSTDVSYHGAVYRDTQKPNVITPLDYNNTHRGSVNLDYRFADNDGGPVLENLGVNLLFSFSSGHPYTFVYYPSGGQVNAYDAGVNYMLDTRSREALEPLNSSTTPWTSNLDLRIDKSFNVTDRILATVYLRVTNLLNTKNVINVFEATGNAYDDGFLSDPARSQAFVDTYGGQAYKDLYTAINLDNGQAYRDDVDGRGLELYGHPRQIMLGIKLAY